MIDYAVVQVRDSEHLVDGEGHQFGYRAPSSADLSPGYYAVFWPAGADTLRYDCPSAFFCGPYRNTLFAKFAALDYLRRMGESGTGPGLVSSSEANGRAAPVPAWP
jgi:hypothetical protein